MENQGTVLYFVNQLESGQEQPVRIIFPDGLTVDADKDSNIDMSHCKYYVGSPIKIHTTIEETGARIVSTYKLKKFGLNEKGIQYIDMEELD
jgi:hypothetical protein